MTRPSNQPKTLTLRSEEQRRALASPLRLELLGLFVDPEPLSVAQIAERMGRPATAIHYHVRLMERTGLLRRTGEQRTGRRKERLFRPAAEVFALDPADPTTSGGAEAAIKTLSMAFRMAVGDMKAALGDSATRDSGPQRNFLGGRFHCRLSKTELAQLNRHLRAIEKMLSRAPKSHEPSAGDAFVSLTLALMPLRNRKVPS